MQAEPQPELQAGQQQAQPKPIQKQQAQPVLLRAS